MITWFRRVRYLLNRHRYERELVQEMQEHRAAMGDPSQFGDTHRLLEQSRDAWGWNWLDDAMQDLALGMRALLKAPAFAVTATVILTFGIGLNLTLFQLLRVGLLRPPPLHDADSWVRFLRSTPTSTATQVPYPLAEFVREHDNGVLASVVLEVQSTVAWGRDAEEQVAAAFVSSNWFEETGYGAAHGRVFSASIDGSSGAPTVVLSDAFWRSRLGADPAVVGRTAYVDRKPVMIAGVASAAVSGLDFVVPDVFLPITQREYLYPESTLLRSWAGGAVDMYGRLRPGVSVAAARAALRSTMRAAAAAHPGIQRDEWLEPLPALHNFMREGERRELLLVVSMMGVLTTLVLIVAAANLGNLVMSRAARRVRELGVRMALGARRTRIVRQLVVEAVPLVALGAAGSLGFAWAAATAIAAVSSFPPSMRFDIEWPAILTALALALLSLIIVGVLPAWKVAQQHLIHAIKDGGQAASRTLDRALVRRVLVASQVAGSCLLLIVAGMMIRGVQRTLAASAAFDFEHAAVLSMPLARHGVTGEPARAYWYAVKERLVAHPEVVSVAIVTASPLGGLLEDRRYEEAPALSVQLQSVDPEYFDTMRIPLVAGRGFRPGDERSVIISRRLALEMYGSMDVLGRPFPKSRGDDTIIGIAADAHSIRIDANDGAELYRLLTPADFSHVELVARAKTDAGRLLPIMREAAMQDPRVIPVARVMRSDFDRRVRARRLAGALSGGIGLLTLALACLGIFGVVSYGVALRTTEIAIRVALGAPPRALLLATLRHVMTPVGTGAIVGIVLAILTGLALGSAPFYLESADPVVFLAALAVFGASGGAAALWPAFRVLRGNPADALRHS